METETKRDLLHRVPNERFYYLRHGRTDWNAIRRIQGQIDVPLNRDGVRQAHEAAARLAHIPLDWIVSSPLQRASETARIVAAQHKLEVEFCDEIMERDFGPMSGRFIDDVRRELGIDSEYGFLHHDPEDGETFLMTVTRFVGALQSILAGHSGHGLIVGHGGMYRALMWLLNGRVDVCRNATPYVFELTAEGHAPRPLV